VLRRDGLERIQVDDGSTLGGLKLAIQDKLGVPLEDMLLSKDPQLVRGTQLPAATHAPPSQQRGS
jgi:hypothetical protein